MKKFLLSLLFMLCVCSLAAAQQLQTIQPEDSLDVRRQKENSNFLLLNSKIGTVTAQVHSHSNKTVLDVVPSVLGSPHYFLSLNAAGTALEWKSIVGGTGITVSHVNGVTTISSSVGSGINSLNGLTGSSQTFINDTNVSVTSGGTNHTIGWTGLLAGGRGGTNNGFFQVLGPSGSLKSFTFPNQSATVLTDAAAVTVAQGGTGGGTFTGLIKGNGTSPFTTVAAPSGNIVGDTDSQTLSNKVLASPGFTSFADFRAGAESRYYNAAGTFYTGFKAHASLAANKIWSLPQVDGSANQVLATDGSGNLVFITPPGASGGEANTASNVGNAGQGLFKQKSGIDLQFRNVAPASSKIAIALDSPNNNVTVDVNEANLNLSNQSGTVPVSKGGTGANSLTGIVVGNGTSPFTTKAAPAGTILGDTDAAVLTNKSIDVEATGNTITLTSKVWLDAAACQGSTASANWDLPSTNAPTAACVSGTNVLKGVLDFPDGATDLTVQRMISLPADFTGSVDVKFRWFTSATTGSADLGIATACSDDGQADDPVFNSFSDVVDTVKASASQLNDASITGITTTGCAGGKLMHIKIARRLSQSGDTLPGTLRLVGVELTFRRAQ